MPVAVRKTIPEDAEILAQIWLESLEDNEMVKLASPEGITPKRLEAATKRTLADLEDPSALCLTAYDKEYGTIMGCAVWRYYPNGKSPTSNDSSNSAQNASQPPVTTTSSISADLDSASNRIFREHVGDRPHAALCKLQVSPAHGRKGVASCLIQCGLDPTPLPSYHFSTPKAAKLYEKHGYHEIDRVTLELSNYGGPSGDVYISPFYYRPGTTP